MTKNTINVCHLYGNLLNTYGDNGNLLVLDYYAKQQNLTLNIQIISIDQTFDPNQFDFVFFGGGQDFEQLIVSKDIQQKKETLIQYIEQNGVMLAICGGYQLLGEYYMNAQNEKIMGIHALPHYTINQENNRFIGDAKIQTELFSEPLIGFENHGGKTYLGTQQKPLGTVLEGYGNNGEDQTEGSIYKNTYCTYYHGPVLAKNEHFAKYLLEEIKKYQKQKS